MTIAPRILAAIASLTVQTVAHAQLGQDLAACRQRWGAPLTGQVDSNGVGTVVFEQAACRVTITFADAVARRCVHASTTLNDTAVSELLRLNAESSSWHVWTPPGAQATVGGCRSWMRTDERAMATLTPGLLTVLGAVPTPSARAAPEGLQTATAEPAVASPGVRTVAPARGMEPAQVDAAPVAALPRARPRIPAEGVSRDEAVATSGAPGGTMTAGAREALIYSWGRVWLKGGRVESVEESPSP